MNNNQKYAGHWERPEWIYDQVQKAEALSKTPEMVALKGRSLPLFQQHMAKQFPDFFQHYTKIFFRVIHGKLNGPLFLMLLKQRQKMDNGEISWQEGNQEVIGASFNLLLRKLPKDLQDSIMNTYKDLVDEEREDMRKAVEEVLTKDNPDQVAEVENVLKNLHCAPQQVEVVEDE